MQPELYWYTQHFYTHFFCISKPFTVIKKNCEFIIIFMYLKSLYETKFNKLYFSEVSNFVVCWLDRANLLFLNKTLETKTILNKVRVSIFDFNWLVFINKIVVYYTMLCVHHVCSSLLRVWTCHFDFSFQLRGHSLTKLARGGG